jgi:hypothetical protein
MAQRRDRRKTRTVSDHAILALHKYYLRAEYMRGQFRDARDRLVAAHGEEALKIRTPSTERFQVEMRSTGCNIPRRPIGEPATASRSGRNSRPSSVRVS